MGEHFEGRMGYKPVYDRDWKVKEWHQKPYTVLVQDIHHLYEWSCKYCNHGWSTEQRTRE